MIGIVPTKWQSFEVLDAAFGGENKVTARIDNNNDGCFNDGKKWGDTLKVFNFETGKATGYHLVKYGEIGVSVKSGDIEITTVPLGASLKKTFYGLDEKAIKAKCPNAKFIDKNGDKKFNEGDSIILYSSDKKSTHVIHMVKSGESEKTTALLLGIDKVSDMKSDRGRLAGDVVWSTVQ